MGSSDARQQPDGEGEGSLPGPYAPRPGARRRRRWFRLKRLVPHSLLARSLLIIVAPLILLQVVSTWAFYDRHYESITRRLGQAAAGEIAAVIAFLERRDPDIRQEEVFDLAETHLGLELRLLPAGTPVEWDRPFWPSLIHDRLGRALEEQVGHPFSIDTTSHQETVEVLVDLGETGVLQALVQRRRLFSSTIYIFLWWMFGSSLVLCAIATVFMRNQIRPIRRLASVADAFGRGLDVGDYRPAGAAEVRRVGHAFLVMRDRLRRQVQQRIEMLAGVSHDLRTPLTRMKLELAMLPPSPEVESLQGDLAQMERMIEGYLAFARGEGSEMPRETDVAALLRHTVEEARRDGAQLDLHLESDLVSVVRQEALRRALTNLIDNAKRYGETVAVTAHRRHKGIEILVDDDGPGIPAERREDVFRPFVRLEASRNFATGGTGLGLTIARDMVRGQGGELSLHDAPGGGLRARVWLPG